MSHSGAESDSEESAPERDGWKLIASVGSRPVASLIEGLLENAGIETELESQLFTQEPVTLGLLGVVKVWVPVERYQEARAVLEDARLEEGDEGQEGVDSQVADDDSG